MYYNAGIGLALAKAVLGQQNGEISAENTADGHACFRIRWYADPDFNISGEADGRQISNEEKEGLLHAENINRRR